MAADREEFAFAVKAVGKTGGRSLKAGKKGGMGLSDINEISESPLLTAFDPVEVRLP